jgi:hypothetical protein
MKIRQLLEESFTNPFGNVLAIANLVMLFRAELSSGAYGKLVSDLNRPAIIMSQLIGGEFTAGLFIVQLIYLCQVRRRKDTFRCRVKRPSISTFRV